MSAPRLLTGGLAVDDRGEVGFVNDFDFAGVKRFYTVSNHGAGFVRAWHAHRHEAKYVMVMQGAAVVGAVAIDDWENPARDAPVERHVLSSHKPSILYIPAGYANGFMSLTDDTKLIFFSTSSLAESKDDDVRYDSRYWDIWTVVER
jgi:dTDP-4-dehydrorhamnose 3,5-epimerase-like enzyme